MNNNKLLVDMLSSMKDINHTVDTLAEANLSDDEVDHIMKKAERIMLAAQVVKEYRAIRAGK